MAGVRPAVAVAGAALTDQVDNDGGLDVVILIPAEESCTDNQTVYTSDYEWRLKSNNIAFLLII